MKKGTGPDFDAIRTACFKTTLGEAKNIIDKIIEEFLDNLARMSQSREDAERICSHDLVGFTIRRRSYNDQTWVLDSVMSLNGHELSEFKQSDVSWGENDLLTPQMRRYLKTRGFSCGIVRVEGDLNGHVIIYKSMVG